MRVIFLILIALSSLSLAELSRDGGIVTDSISKLQWQDDAVGSTMKWEEAIDYCENTLTLGGYSDWRLPSINELRSIVDRDKYNPAIVSAFTQVSISHYYWSSTTTKNNTNYTWLVHFKSGNVHNDYGYAGEDMDKDSSQLVRCVRAGQ